MLLYIQSMLLVDADLTSSVGRLFIGIFLLVLNILLVAVVVYGAGSTVRKASAVASNVMRASKRMTRMSVRRMTRLSKSTSNASQIPMQEIELGELSEYMHTSNPMHGRSMADIDTEAVSIQDAASANEVNYKSPPITPGIIRLLTLSCFAYNMIWLKGTLIFPPDLILRQYSDNGYQRLMVYFAFFVLWAVPTFILGRGGIHYLLKQNAAFFLPGDLFVFDTFLRVILGIMAAPIVIFQVGAAFVFSLMFQQTDTSQIPWLSQDPQTRNGVPHLYDFSECGFLQMLRGNSSFNYHSLVALIQAIRSGDIAMVKGEYLIHLAHANRHFVKRQDLPDDAYLKVWPPRWAPFGTSMERLQFWLVFGCALLFLVFDVCPLVFAKHIDFTWAYYSVFGPFASLIWVSYSVFVMPVYDLIAGYEIVALSYLWLTPEHPDANGEQLRFLAPLIQAFEEEEQKPSAFFVDFMSLYQHDSEYTAFTIIEEMVEKTTVDDDWKFHEHKVWILQQQGTGKTMKLGERELHLARLSEPIIVENTGASDASGVTLCATMPEGLGDVGVWRKLPVLDPRNEPGATWTATVDVPPEAVAGAEVTFKFPSKLNTETMRVGSVIQVRALRSDAENASFKRGLTQYTNLMYGSEKTHVWMLTKVPGWATPPEDLPPESDLPPGTRDYSTSGWCFTERAISSVVTPAKQLLDLGLVYDPTTKLPIENFTLEMCAHARDPPMTPAMFEAIMELGPGEVGAKKFTSGADKKIVKKIFHNCYDLCIRDARSLKFGGLGWSDEDLRILRGSLKDCRGLLLLDLHANPNITMDGLRHILDTLGNLRVLDLRGTGIRSTDEPEIQAACPRLVKATLTRKITLTRKTLLVGVIESGEAGGDEHETVISPFSATSASGSASTSISVPEDDNSDIGFGIRPSTDIDLSDVYGQASEISAHSEAKEGEMKDELVSPRKVTARDSALASRMQQQGSSSSRAEEDSGEGNDEDGVAPLPGLSTARASGISAARASSPGLSSNRMSQLQTFSRVSLAPKSPKSPKKAKAVRFNSM